MYEIYQRLLDEKGLKNSDVARATGISNMTLSDWKRGVSKPKEDKMRKIAEFLGVTFDYLTTGKEKEINYSDELVGILSKVRKDKELIKALEKYFTLSEEKKNHVINTINMMSEE